jgi:ubiquinone/menaquinone biosynthesis C-methylase UbiE
MDPAAREAERIRAEYERRDSAAAVGASPWLDPVYRVQLHELESALLEELRRAGAPLAGARALEVGCGSGYFLGRLLDYGAAHAAGIDLVDERIAVARERHPRLELVVGDATALPWPDASFDLVTQFTCLSSVLDREVRRAIAAEMWRVLAPGGALVSYDVRAPRLPVRAFRRAAGPLSRRGEPGTPAEPVEVAELAEWFPAAALRHRSVGVDPGVGALLARLHISPRLAARVPALRIHELVVARKRG